MEKRRLKIIVTFGLVFGAVVCFGLGWVLNGFINSKSDLVSPLRLGGYKYISPLLVCNTGFNFQGLISSQFEKSLNDYYQKALNDETIFVSSVYYRDLQSGEEIEINPEEKYYPASLRKVPLLIALFKIVENNLDYLDKTRVRLSGLDQNLQQEIIPADVALPGKEYTLHQLAEKMIINSDNNSASALTSLVGVETVVVLFEKLKVPFVVFNSDYLAVDNRDFITAHDYSIFLRVLYNATYLNTSASEKVIELMVKSKYENGLRAGVPSHVEVAHKFGLLSEKDDSGLVGVRQLHDCGIVYHPKRPYLLCVMTKSRAPIEKIEIYLKGISELVYQEVDKLEIYAK